MGVIIKESSSTEKEIWFGIYEGKHQHSIFQDPQWLEIVGANKFEIKLFSVFENGNLLAFFPLTFLVSRFFRRCTLPYLTPHIGLVFLNIDESIVDVNRAHEALFGYLEKLKVDYLNYGISPESTSKCCIGASKFLRKSRTYQLDLNLTEDELKANLLTDKKRNIKKAQKDNLRVAFESNSETLINLIKCTYNRQNKENEWLIVAKELIDNYKNSFQVVCYKGDVPLAGVFVVYDSEKAYYIFGGFDDKQKNHSAGPYAMWNAILRAKELGLNIFDFEGSEIPQIEKYFQRFGSLKKDYYRIEKNSFRYKCFQKIR
jgi:hypothetical protein